MLCLQKCQNLPGGPWQVWVGILGNVLGGGAFLGVPGAGLCVLELAYLCQSLPGCAKAGLGKLGLDLSRCWLAVSIFA